jgi:hypothetical protein
MVMVHQGNVIVDDTGSDWTSTLKMANIWPGCNPGNEYQDNEMDWYDTDSDLLLPSCKPAATVNEELPMWNVKTKIPSTENNSICCLCIYTC